MFLPFDGLIRILVGSGGTWNKFQSSADSNNLRDGDGGELVAAVKTTDDVFGNQEQDDEFAQHKQCVGDATPGWSLMGHAHLYAGSKSGGQKRGWSTEENSGTWCSQEGAARPGCDESNHGIKTGKAGRQGQHS